MNLGRVAATLVVDDRPVRVVARGHSMTPRIRDRDEVVISPVDPRDVERGDIVLARVRGRWYLHLVRAADKARVQISNNHGHVNGWTRRENVVGRVE